MYLLTYLLEKFHKNSSTISGDISKISPSFIHSFIHSFIRTRQQKKYNCKNLDPDPDPDDIQNLVATFSSKATSLVTFREDPIGRSYVSLLTDKSRVKRIVLGGCNRCMCTANLLSFVTWHTNYFMLQFSYSSA